MPVVVVDLARPPDVCWRSFTDARLFAAWMPGLRRATVIASEPDGLPREVLFEFSTSLTYSLTYRYDVAARTVHWDPAAGARDAVRGSARLEPHGDGTRMTYQLEQGAGRAAGDLVLGGAHTITSAFARWIDGR